MIALLNVVVTGLLYGLIAAAAVELAAMWAPRFAAVAATIMFPFVAVAPLLGLAHELPIPLDDRRLDFIGSILCALIACGLVAREIVAHQHAAQEHRGRTLATPALRRAIGVDAVYIQPGAPPATLGVFRRSIVIPAESIDHAIVLHERNHFRWRDPMAAALRRVLRALFWFHPGLWFLDRAAVLATELAADAAAVGGATQPERRDFASLLVSAARAVPPASAFATRRARDLEARVRVLIGCGAMTRAVIAISVLIGALALLPFVPHFVAVDHVVISNVVRIG